MNALPDHVLNAAFASDPEISKWIDGGAMRAENLREYLKPKTAEMLDGVANFQAAAQRTESEYEALLKKVNEYKLPPSWRQRVKQWLLWAPFALAGLVFVARLLAYWDAAAAILRIDGLLQYSFWYFAVGFFVLLTVVLKVAERLTASARAEDEAVRVEIARRENLPAAKEAAEQQRKGFEAARNAQIVRAARSVIASQTRSYDKAFPTRLTTTGLSDIITLEDTIPTTGRLQLQSLIAQMRNAGTVGVAGPRGAGKTTLLKWFCRPDRAESMPGERRICVLASAPVSYDARDFILHLFAEVCSEVLAFVGLPTDALAKSEETNRSQDNLSSEKLLAQIVAVTRIVLALGALLFVLGVITLAVDFGERLPPPKAQPSASAAMATNPASAAPAPAPTDIVRSTEPKNTKQGAAEGTFSGVHDSLLTFGTTLLCIGAAGWLFRRRLARGVAAPPSGPSLERSLANLASMERIHRYQDPPSAALWQPIAERACRHLWEIQFQLSFSSGWEGSLEISGLGASYSETESIARNQRTLPEIVDEFQDFVRSLPENTRIVVGIDEMDKMGDAAKAQQFLNDIKAMFGLAPNCLFLISVSESAMSSFQRRGLAVRDAFDSSFHEVLSVRYLSLDESVRLLERRIIGLPMPFLALCHCLSGGLPRDLVRACRKVVHASGGLLGNQPPAGADIMEVLSAVLEGELVNRVNAVQALLDHLHVEPELSAFTNQLNQLRTVNWAAVDLVKTAGEMWNVVQQVTGTNEDENRQRAELRTFARETAAHVFFLAAIHRLFVGEKFGYAIPSQEDDAFKARLDRLAETWQRGAGNPTLAVALIRQFWIAEGWPS